MGKSEKNEIYLIGIENEGKIKKEKSTVFSFGKSKFYWEKDGEWRRRSKKCCSFSSEQYWKTD